MSRRYNIVILDNQIVNRGIRKVLLQRVPMRTIVDRKINAEFRSRYE